MGQPEREAEGSRLEVWSGYDSSRPPRTFLRHRLLCRLCRCGHSAAAPGRRPVLRGREPASRQPEVLHQRLRAGGAELRRAHHRRQGRCGHLRRRHPRHAAGARSALATSTIPRPTPACAKTSAATTTAWAWSSSSRTTRSTSSRPTRTRPPSAPAFIPATSSPPSTAKPPTAGPPTRWPRRSKAPRARTSRSPPSAYGQPKPLVFDLVRDEIPHPSVDLKYEIRPGVGYIHLTAVPGDHRPGDAGRHQRLQQPEGPGARPARAIPAAC